MATVFDLKGISCEFGDYKVLENVTFTAYTGDRIGIVGDNGCGKTTLLNIISGRTDDLYTGGECLRYSGDIGCLSQKTGEDNRQISVYNDFLSVFKELQTLEKDIETLEAGLPETADRLSGLYEKYTESGGLTYKSRIKSTLAGLNFPECMYEQPVSTLSGGQKIRLALGKLLLENHEVLLLDEPTNHLDSESIDFLRDTLKNYKGTLIIVSHDRYFLDEVTEKTLLIDNGYGTLYNAPYSKYRELRDADTEYKRRLYLRQQKEIAHIRDVIKTQTAWNQEHNYVTAENWRKKLDRMVMLEDPDAVKETDIRIKFEPAARGANEVLTIKNLSFGFSKEPLFRNFNLELKRGERLLITGKNGGGKSTLLKIITGQVKGYNGELRLGANITIGYYSQDMRELNTENTPFEEIFEAANYEYYHGQGGLPKFHNITAVRNALAAFGFTGDDVFKKIDLLSGGERARLQMLKLTYNKGNLLILDEPTNHLDIRTCEILETALREFDGTVICVSHDRYFADKIATRTICLDEFSLAAETIPPSGTALISGEGSGKNDFIKAKEQKSLLQRLNKKLQTLEKNIGELENKIKAAAEILENPASDYNAVAAAFAEKEALSEALDKAETEYLLCSEELEKADTN